ncbi:MAG: calcium-binding protein [Thermoleophilia bacterium]|nr:calcium-binding protein [Thermoleophilia bacterium]
MRRLPLLLASLLLPLLAPTLVHAAPGAVTGGSLAYGDGTTIIDVLVVTTPPVSCGTGCTQTTIKLTEREVAPLAGTGCVSESALTIACTVISAAPELRITGSEGSDIVDASGSAVAPTIGFGGGDDTAFWCDCPAAPIAVDGGAGTDTLSFERAPRGIQLVQGGIVAMETLVGSVHADVLDVPVRSIFANDGNDIVRSGALAQVIDLGGGNDVFVEQSPVKHAQVVTGGTGRDRYEANGTKREKFEICLDERAVVCPMYDGRKFERDRIGSDVEEVRMFGTSDDLLIGSPVANTLEGGGGNDILIGGAGADTLRGGAGLDLASFAIATLDPRGVHVTFDGRRNDGNPRSDLVGTDIEIVAGTRKNDKLIGGRGLDALFGDAGNDTIVGGKGPDLLVGGPGNDVIDARDGVKDEIECGPGSDRIRADLFDTITKDCEFRRFT